MSGFKSNPPAGVRSYIMPPLQGPAPRPSGRPLGSGMKGMFDDTTLPDGDFKESEEAIDARITKTFRVFDKRIQRIIAGEENALVCAGAGGIGKTFGAEKALREAASENIIDLAMHNTALSAVELYQLLYRNKERGKVTLIDDCDSIWSDMESIGILKNALDTKDQRIVHWGKNSWVLDQAGTPNEYEFEGTVIFLTNLDIAKMIERHSKFQRHWHALISRATFLDMGIHSKREVLVRIKQVLRDTSFLADHHLSDEQGITMVEWLTVNLPKLRAISVRTCIELGRLIRSGDADWADDAEVLLFKRS